MLLIWVKSPHYLCPFVGQLHLFSLPSAGEKLGSMVVNRIRLVFAVILLTTAHFFFKGQLFPFSANQEQLFWLSLSGVVGLVLGDGFLIKSYIIDRRSPWNLDHVQCACYQHRVCLGFIGGKSKVF